MLYIDEFSTLKISHKTRLAGDFWLSKTRDQKSPAQQKASAKTACREERKEARMNNASVSLQTVGHEVGQVQEINMAALRGVTGFLKRLPSPHAQRFVGNPSLITDAVASALEALLPKRMIIPHNEVERWNKYYHDEHGITHSFEGLEVPAEMKYPTRLIVMHTDVSNRPQRVAIVYKKRCADKWWQYADDLDVAVPKHDRASTYAIRVADVPEAPKGFDEKRQKNLSSQDAWDRGWIITTLPERLIDGDMYLREHKKHLDRTVVTVCAGSRDADGDVPSVDLDIDGEVRVNYWLASNANDGLRFRLAIV